MVRPGSEYGVDYVLYDGHPSIVHSSYCVLALTGSKCPEVLQWTDIEAASRVCSEVPMITRPLHDDDSHLIATAHPWQALQQLL